MEEFIKEYIYYVPDSILYEWSIDEGSKPFDYGDIGRRMNLLGHMLGWEYEGRYNARRELPRSKYRKLCKMVNRRFKNLRWKYRKVL